ncbi:hypothetical protein PIB30_094767 [Stylosanthes scabra]|uniref:Transposase (Putative), gypsy type n=1 Tax=Stylosanthes scabra TaxID=79078 RepID=A0ABU6ZUC6_9FABA|nr:hypothetical protein [Stylosanthes scabra]
MAKKKSCQNVRNPRVLSPVERELYGWVDAEVFTQSSVLAPEHLPEFCREVGLARDLASEGDFVLEAAGPSDRLPFQALEGEAPFLWVYAELFTRLGVRFPLSDFQREVLTRCQVAVSQLHLNGWGFLRTFERVCLHFGFRPSWRIFLFTYHLHAPPPGNGFLSFRAYQDSLLLDMEKQSRFDRLKQKMAEVAGVGPRSVLPHVRVPPATSGASASSQAAPAPAPVAPAVPNPPPAATDKGRAFRDPVGKPFPVQGEGGGKEDPSADLKRKGRKRKGPGTAAEEAALGADAAWIHGVSPIERAFPKSYNFRGALDAGLTNNATREILSPLAAELESCRAALLKEKREAEGLAKSLGDRQVALESAEAAAAHWQGEWKSLAEETGEMVQETFDILMDQVRHLHPAIDFSVITLDTRWDPKARRIYNPKVEAQEQAGPEAEKQPDPEVGLQAMEDVQEVLPEA